MSDTATAQEGTLPEGQSSPESQGQTSTQTRTYTEEEFKAAQNRLSDKLAEAGRKHKAEIESISSQVTEHQDRIKSLMSQIDEMEDKGITNPDAKQVKADQRALRQLKAELLTEKANLTREKQSWESEKAELAQVKALKKAQDVAKGYEGIDPEDLVKFTDGSEANMEAFAKKFGKPKWEEPKKPDGTRPISEASAGGMSDEAFWTWAAEPGRNLSGADLKRLKAIRDKKMNGG